MYILAVSTVHVSIAVGSLTVILTFITLAYNIKAANRKQLNEELRLKADKDEVDAKFEAAKDEFRNIKAMINKKADSTLVESMHQDIKMILNLLLKNND
jgi:hypothetical protein